MDTPRSPTEPDRERQPCADRGTPTIPDQRFMLADEVWALTGMGWDGWLCVGCCEARFGRQLTRGDFELGELDYAPAGPLLRSRLA